MLNNTFITNVFFIITIAIIIFYIFAFFIKNEDYKETMVKNPENYLLDKEIIEKNNIDRMLLQHMIDLKINLDKQLKDYKNELDDKLNNIINKIDKAKIKNIPKKEIETEKEKEKEKEKE